MKQNLVPPSPSLLRRAHTAARPFAARLFAVPLLGYLLRILVGVLKLPRFNVHLRRIDTEVKRLETIKYQKAQLDGEIAQYDARIAVLEALNPRVTSLESAWRQHVPSFLNAVGTVPAFARELAVARDCIDKVTAKLEQHDKNISTICEQVKSNQHRIDNATTRLDNDDASIRAIWERIEFVRREILFEMAHGDRSSARTNSTSRIKARIIATEKVAMTQANGSLRLNLGCGHIALPDYVNVDRRDLPGVDVVAEVGDLPFEPGSVREIFSAHLVEHFPQEEMRRRLLPYWHSLLRPGATFRAITPDAATMLAEAGTGTYPFEDFREVAFGAQDYDGDYHYNLFTAESLRRLLLEAGFDDIQVPFVGRRNGKCFEFEIVAMRP